jgi:hypothetical protein
VGQEEYEDLQNNSLTERNRKFYPIVVKGQRIKKRKCGNAIKSLQKGGGEADNQGITT